MKRSYGLLIGLTLVAMAYAQTVCALTVVYVTTNGTGDGSSWVSATNSIQGAIDVIETTSSTNTVAVSNGVYNIGAVTGYPEGATVSNRVAIYKAITVRAASSDPADTIIEGALVLGEVYPGTNGPGTAAVRSVYMTNGASLIGITVSNGATLVNTLDPNGSGGGIWCESTNTVISNCVVTGNAAARYGGGTYRGTLYDCLVVANSAGYDQYRGGGGTYQATAYNCQIVSNLAFLSTGGGMYGGKAVSCYIAYNTVGFSGAGSAYPQGAGFGAGGILISSTVVLNRTISPGELGIGGGVGGTSYDDRIVDMTNCIVSGNTAGIGGGVTGVTAIDCLISDNSGRDGGGTRWSTLINCMVVDNSFKRRGGGLLQSDALNCNILSNIQTSTSYSSPDGGAGATGHSGIPSILTNCLLAANSATLDGGGASRSTLINCTIVNNTASGTGGGVDDSTVTNCISFGNNVTDDTVVAAYSMGVGYPLVDGNITNDPLFIDAAAGNYRLTEESPCKNTGTNLNWTTADLDLAGLPRLVGTVDMGAYERPPEPGTIITVR